MHKLLFPQLVLIFEICNKGPKIWYLQKYIQGINQVGKIGQHVNMVDITWKTKRVRWNHVIIWMWELSKMTIDSWRQRHKLQMKHLLRRDQKKIFFDFLFSCAILYKKEKKKKINSEEADLYTGSMVWNTKGKSGKRWDLGNIKRQNFF